MRHRSLIVASILALSLSGYAYAQDQTATQPSPPLQTTQPATPDTNATGNTNAAGDSTAQPAVPDTKNTVEVPATKQDNTTAEAPAPAPTLKSGVIVSSDKLDSVQAWTANEFIGKTVYGTNNENIGEINDIVFANDGGIVGVVLGVGGFLGIGEKDVLVSLDSIKMVKPDGSDTMNLVVDASKDALEAAPSFDRVAKRYVAEVPAKAPATQTE